MRWKKGNKSKHTRDIPAMPSQRKGSSTPRYLDVPTIDGTSQPIEPLEGAVGEFGVKPVKDCISGSTRNCGKVGRQPDEKNTPAKEARRMDKQRSSTEEVDEAFNREQISCKTNTIQEKIVDPNRADGNTHGGGKPQEIKNKKKRRPSSTGNIKPDDCAQDCHGKEKKSAHRLTPAERQARKARARAAKLDEAAFKKETALRDARQAELEQEDDGRKFKIQIMDPIHTSQDNRNLHLLGESGDSDSAFARLRAPLPNITAHPGHTPSPQLQELSVSYPSGIRRASALTTSLELRLGPTPVGVLAEAKHSSIQYAAGGANCSLGGYSGGSCRLDGEASLVRCHLCGTVLPEVQLEAHVRSTCRLLPCPLCRRLLLPADLARHLEEACPDRCEPCSRCGEDVPLSSFSAHARAGDCERRVVPCTACGSIFLADELGAHKARDCPMRKLRCKACGDVVPAKDLPSHSSSRCPKLVWNCPCGQAPFPFSERAKHLRKCEAFLDAWEASIEKLCAKLPKSELCRRIGKVMILTREEDPKLGLVALAECLGNAPLAARRLLEDRIYKEEVNLAANIVNVKVFLNSLSKPGKRGQSKLWRGENYTSG